MGIIVRKAETERFGQCESRSEGEGTVRGGSVRPSGMDVNVILRRSHVKV